MQPTNDQIFVTMTPSIKTFVRILFSTVVVPLNKKQSNQKRACITSSYPHTQIIKVIYKQIKAFDRCWISLWLVQTVLILIYSLFLYYRDDSSSLIGFDEKIVFICFNSNNSLGNTKNISHVFISCIIFQTRNVCGHDIKSFYQYVSLKLTDL